MTITRPWLLALFCAVGGCYEPPSAGTDGGVGIPDATPVSTTSRLVVFQTMGFTRETDPGVAAGFNLDDRVSEAGDRETCGHGDFTSPGGVPGIDNQLATLVPLFDAAGIGAVESLLQSAIEDGGILFMLQVDGIDSTENDDSVRLTFRVGHGVPLLGTDGLLLAGQTFSLNTESPESVVEDAVIEDRELRAGPFEARLPIVVFGVNYELTMRQARIRARLTEGGGLSDGIMGGAVDITEIFAIGETAAQDDPSVLRAIEILVTNAGDMDKEDGGECRRISATLEFAAVSAFLFDEEEDTP